MTVPRLVVHMTLDDLGCEQIGRYGRNGVLPGLSAQPFLDMLWDEGVRFEKHFAEGFCSPYRACHLTGRHTEDTGIGDIIELESDQPLLKGELLIPEVLKIYYGADVETAVVGKWHLGNAQVGGKLAALEAGFDYAFTTERNADYFTTLMTCQGRDVEPLGRYIPDVLGEATLAWIRRFASRRSRRGYLYLPFHLPHDPYHRPTADLYDAGTWTLPDQVASPQSGAGVVPYGKAMHEALDTWMTRIWDSIPASLRAETLLLVSSDNGSDTRMLSQEFYADGTPYSGGHGKRSNYDPGIRTPGYAYSENEDFVAAPGRSLTGLVQSVDLFGTTLDAFDVPWQEIVAARGNRTGVTAAERSKSFYGSLTADQATTDREYVYTGIFNANGYNRGTTPGRRMITDGRYKLIFPDNGTWTSASSLYDIETDPKELASIDEDFYEQTHGGAQHPARIDLGAAWNAFYESMPEPVP